MITYKIYCITNMQTHEHYIGVTSQENLNRRIQKGKGYSKDSKLGKAIKLYNWKNFYVDVLDETDDKDEAGIKEAYYIGLFNSINCGYNTQTGGFKGYTFQGKPQKEYKFSKEHRDKLSKAHKGKHHSVNTEFKKGEIHGNKKVRCVETGLIFESIADAARTLNLGYHIGGCCNGTRKTCGGYHWEYVDEKEGWI